MKKFTHFDNNGKVKMVDVSKKEDTFRTAKARGYIILNSQIIKKIKENKIQKGDALAVAKIAGINAAKKTSDLIPLCHQIKLTGINLDFEISESENKIIAVSTIKGYDKTGVEMEALTAVVLSLVTIYDMCKAVSKKMIIGGIELIKKTGGKSDYEKEC
ncbi:MAG: cyclic pyranopterin monophosphate synthase MoaC [Actinobacteria bacterium]|nr:cyclic pyranopterin monophosphate synthase MoaC [Cyanobacteriota bacterium]MCL5772395.1 cyclic pyranopterin monophosphate synthase MoaC [Actinomycetota bacterium]